MLKAIMFDLDDTLLWDEKSVGKAFEETCNFAVEQYDIDPKQLEENVRLEAKKLYESYDTYEFTQKIGTGTFEAFWATYEDEEEGFSELQKIIKEYRVNAWDLGLQAVDIEDKELATKLAEVFPENRKKHI